MRAVSFRLKRRFSGTVFVQNGVGIGFQVQASGPGAIKAGSGRFLGASVATASGAKVAIPERTLLALG